MSVDCQFERVGSVKNKITSGRGPVGLAGFFSLLRITIALGTVSSFSFAADDNTIITPGTAHVDAPSKATGAGLGSTSLLLGIALAGAGGWMVWRNRHGKPIGREMRALAIDESRSLGNRQYLIVASYEDKKFLIGVCPGRIELLSPLDGTAPKEKSRE